MPAIEIKTKRDDTENIGEPKSVDTVINMMIAQFDLGHDPCYAQDTNFDLDEYRKRIIGYR